jgi:formylglycine-generating enzyme required for sulfatase activity
MTAPLTPDPVTTANTRLSALGVAVPTLVAVPAGHFRMGSPTGGPAEQPTHPVALSAFALGETPVTNAQWLAFSGATQYQRAAAPPPADGYPVVQVTWPDARAYVAWLSQVSRLPLDLPSEAQWEYACRAGSVGDFGLPIHGAAELDDFAWTQANANGQLQQVRQKRPNAWGLYDLHGLVWEWTRDYFAPYLPYPEPLLDPVTSTDSGRGRVFRGGSWLFPPEFARAGYREAGHGDQASAADLGFRVALRL